MLASACFFLNDLTEARAAFEKVTLLRPDYAEAWSYYGVVLQRLGDAHGARKFLEIALERGARNPVALRSLRSLYESARDPGGEYAVLKRMDEVACLDAVSVDRLAVLHLGAGNLRGAAQMFRRFTEQQSPPGPLFLPASVFAPRELLEETDAIDRWHLSWLAGALVDRSHAIAVCEELNHEQKRRAHWMVFQHQPLLDVIESIANPHADFENG
jgi:tetratricopeptide (TPR) repeat protein